ncbi:exosortase/archaeosortase family protein [bacterium]|nr:exosortase/archaeosortase family protein [bacterium]
MTTLRDLVTVDSGKIFLARVMTLMLAGLWVYWPTVQLLFNKWNNSPEYSHGYLVPIFSIVLLWNKIDLLDLSKLKVNVWGIGLIAIAMVTRFLSFRYYMEWFDLLSIIPFVGGIVLLSGGWHAFKWSASSVLFLAFMLPLLLHWKLLYEIL